MKLFKSRLFLAGLLIGLFGWAACTKSTPFGAELLDDQTADYAFTDSITISTTIEREDSTVTADESAVFPYMLCGRLVDPVFGTTQIDLYTLATPINYDPDYEPTTDRVDSVRLYLRYSSLGVYGDTTQTQTIRVLRLQEALNPDKSYFAIDTLAVQGQIGLLENFKPRPTTSDSLIATDTRAPYITIPMDKAFGEEILNYDTAKFATNARFWEAIRGFKITAGSNDKPGAMLAFSLNDDNYSFIRIYYTRTDTATKPKAYDLYFASGNKFNNIKHNYTATPAGDNLGKSNTELLYLQGNNGIRVKIQLPDLAARLPKNAVINQAYLEFTVANTDTAIYKYATQLVITEKPDTSQLFIPDVLYSLGASGSSGFGNFGGQPIVISENGIKTTRYLLTISSYLQELLADASPRSFNLRVYPPSRAYPSFASPRRVVLYGPGSKIHPPKLKVKYTTIQ